MKVIGAGLGRTGTFSLKAALEQLGLGPCYHMHEVILDKEKKLPQWAAALAGDPDWAAIYEGYHSAVDWPTAAFYRELNAFYPAAKFILTTRSAESWAESYGSTIAEVNAQRDSAPPEMRPFMAMSSAVTMRSGLRDGLTKEELAQLFIAHTASVKETISPERLLEFEVSQGWAPLCAFLGVPVPDHPFPKTNDREEFWRLVNS